ncbi:MAG: hypothetical protein AB7W16_21445 [Candidatus Obscuribacterales bacterium]
MEIFVWLERAGLFAVLVLLEIALSVDNLEGLREAFAGLKSKTAGKAADHSEDLLEALSAWFGLGIKISCLIAIVQFLHVLDPWLAGSIFGSSRQFLLSFGGLFLIICGVSEIRSHFDEGRITREISWSSTPGILLVQVLAVDFMLSVDSIVVAISVSSNLVVIATAMLVAQIIVTLTGDRIEQFFKTHKGFMTVIMAFIVLIGVVSVVRGLGLALAEECLLAALVFGFTVEWLNHLREKNRDSSVAPSVASVEVSDPVPETPTPPARLHLLKTVEASGVFDEHHCRQCHIPTVSLFPFCLHCGQEQEQALEKPDWRYRYTLDV